MALVFPGVENLSYNGIRFFLFKSSVSAKPRLDSAGRTTTWVDFDITVDRALIEGNPALADPTTENTLLAMRRALTKTGQALTFEHKGYGPLSVNVPGSPIRDANFGPHPQMLDWQPAGNNLNAIVAWKCQTSIPQCPDARYTVAIAELNYNVEHTQDVDGYPKIVTNGHVLIPMTRSSDTTIPDHIDRYKEQIQTQVPLGFVRQNMKFSYNEAKTQISFSYEDVAERHPLPIGVTQAKITHKVSSQGPAFAVWNCSVGGSINVPPQVPKEHAFRVFLGIVAERLSIAQQQVAAARIAAPGGGVFGTLQQAINAALVAQGRPPISLRPTPLGVIPLNFSASNEINGHGANFQMDFRVMLRRNIFTDVNGMGVWRPFPDASWEAWRRSMEQLKVHNVRGPYQLRWNPADDAIIDLCVANVKPPPTVKPPNVDPHSPGGIRPQIPSVPGAAGGAGIGGNIGTSAGDSFLAALADNSSDLDPVTGKYSLAQSLPNPEASWIAYGNVLEYQEPRGRYARHRPLDGNVTDPAVVVDAAGDANDLGRIQNDQLATASKDVPDILQEIDAPFGIAILRGGAIRLGAHTPLPNLLTCKGLLARRNRVISSIPDDIIGRMGDIPLVRTNWTIEFLLTRPPFRLPAIVNPITGIDGGPLRG